MFPNQAFKKRRVLIGRKCLFKYPIRMRPFLLLSAFLLCAGSLFIFVKQSTSRRPTFFSEKVFSDLNELQEKDFFPKSFRDLFAIRLLIHTNDETLKEQIYKNLNFPFETTKDGHFILSMDAIPNFDEKNESLLILQFNLFERSTSNKVWEASRQYKISHEDLKYFETPNQKDKKKPD